MLAWAQNVKPDLLQLQQQTGIPALFMAAQMCHESDSGGEPSQLAGKCNNWSGIKWAAWQQEFGCYPVNMATWEEINGERTDLIDAFMGCPNWGTFLRAYASLLTGRTYSFCLKYAADPLLYGSAVGRIWATDSRYTIGLSRWMIDLWEIYADTLRPAQPEPRIVTVLDAGGTWLCDGWLQSDRTVVPVRALAEAMGLEASWDAGGPTVTLSWPGGTK